MASELINSLSNEIASIIKPFDFIQLNNMIDSIPLRRARVSEVKKANFIGKFATNHYANAKIDAAGGKEWLDLLRCYSDDNISEIIAQKEQIKINFRNEKFALKLSKLNVSSVLQS